MPSVFTSSDPPNSAMRYHPSHRSTEAQNGWSTGQWCSTPKWQSQHETQVQQCHLKCPLMALWWCLWKSLETQTSTIKSTPSETNWPDFWYANRNSGQIHFWALSPERSGWWWKCFQHQAQREASHPASHMSGTEPGLCSRFPDSQRDILSLMPNCFSC